MIVTNQHQQKSHILICTVSQIKWRNAPKSYIDSTMAMADMVPSTQPRHRRMLRLYCDISHALYPYWALHYVERDGITRGSGPENVQ